MANELDPYEASLVTRDRALKGKQDAIDVLTRLLSQLENNEMADIIREKLEVIIDNPSVITDEVFNNIMSATNEVLDATYENETREFLDAARARGVSGPALQTQLQRAKNAKTEALAQAYRDAIIQRAQEGLSTQLEAIGQLSNFLMQFFDQKRVLTEDLANVLQSVVEEPFVNPGPPSLPQAPGGGSGGGSAWSPIMGDYSAADGNGFGTSREDFINRTQPNRYLLEQGIRGEEGRDIFGLNTEAYKRQQEQIKQLQANQVANQPESAVPMVSRESGVVEGTAYFGPDEPVTNLAERLKQGAADTVRTSMPQPLESGNEASEALAGRIASYSSPTAGVQVQNVRLPMGGSLSLTPEATARGGTEASLQLPGQDQPLVFGGGQAEANRVLSTLIPQYGAEKIIGTSSGAGVRTSAQPAGTQIGDIKRNADGTYTVITGLSGAKETPYHTYTGTLAQVRAAQQSLKSPTRKGSALLTKLVDEGGGAGTVIETSEGFGVRK